MKSLQKDLDLLLTASRPTASRVLFKIEAQIRYCKNHGYSVKPIEDLLSAFVHKLSANKYDKTRESIMSFIKNGINYLFNMCAYD